MAFVASRKYSTFSTTPARYMEIKNLLGHFPKCLTSNFLHSLRFLPPTLALYFLLLQLTQPSFLYFFISTGCTRWAFISLSFIYVCLKTLSLHACMHAVSESNCLNNFSLRQKNFSLSFWLSPFFRLSVCLSVCPSLALVIIDFTLRRRRNLTKVARVIGRIVESATGYRLAEARDAAQNVKI